MGFDGVRVGVRVCLSLESFFLAPSFACVWRKVERWSSLEEDLGFFLSDRSGELEARDRGELELDPSGLEESDFLEEKKRPLNTIFSVSEGLVSGGVAALA